VSQDLRTLIDDTQLEGELVQTGFLDRSAVRGLVDDHRSGREGRSKQIWQLLTLKLWYCRTDTAGVGL
jgi:asparagine synthase (glutamine-hydrolysing)